MARLTSRGWQKWCYTYSGCGSQEALCAYAFSILDHCPGSALRPTMEENWVCLLAVEGSQGREARSVRQLPMHMARYMRKACRISAQSSCNCMRRARWKHYGTAPLQLTNGEKLQSIAIFKVPQIRVHFYAAMANWSNDS